MPILLVPEFQLPHNNIVPTVKYWTLKMPHMKVTACITDVWALVFFSDPYVVFILLDEETKLLAL